MTPRDAERASARARRLRSPLLLGLGALLALEAVGGLVIFFARLATGTTPGQTLHVTAGIVMTGFYGVYQWRHWHRVAPWRPRLDYVLGLIATLALALTQLSGLWLGWQWWQAQLAGRGQVPYFPGLSAAHNVMSMFVLTFISAHLGAVLWRDARARSESDA